MNVRMSLLFGREEKQRVFSFDPGIIIITKSTETEPPQPPTFADKVL
jgi:hypothetical protein